MTDHQIHTLFFYVQFFHGRMGDADLCDAAGVLPSFVDHFLADVAGIRIAGRPHGQRQLLCQAARAATRFQNGQTP